MNHTSSHHLSASKSGLLSSQSALVGWLEEHIRLLFPEPSESQPAKRGKPPELTLPHLCLALWVSVFCGATGFTDVWRWLVVERLGSFPKLSITDDAVRKAVERWGPQTFANLYTHLCDALPKVKLSQSTTGLATFATEIVAMDESTLDAIHRHRKQGIGNPKRDASDFAPCNSTSSFRRMRRRCDCGRNWDSRSSVPCPERFATHREGMSMRTSCFARCPSRDHRKRCT